MTTNPTITQAEWLPEAGRFATQEEVEEGKRVKKVGLDQHMRDVHPQPKEQDDGE